MERLDEVLIRRAEEYIARGMTVEQAAKRAGISRASLYNYGVRSIRGYAR